jgi:DNA polymerase III epsilon subunit-like protein
MSTSPTTANLNRASLPPRTSTSAPGSAPTNALRVWPELDGHSNQELRYALGRATPFPGFERGAISPHRAVFDVVVTAAIFEELIKKARWSELVQWSGEPALYTKFHFGKYRGQRYEDIAASDPDYLRWIIVKSELEESIKHSARYWLTLSGRHEEPL